MRERAESLPSALGQIINLRGYIASGQAALLRPQILLLENPLFVFDESQREEAAAYLKEIAAAGRTVIVSLKTPEEMDMF